ncbi:TIGR03936 family radical SAM-associated protein [Elusimicrobiota bacterium]
MNIVFARIKYSKIYPANFIGYLDTVAALKRSMRIAGWPLKFTQGFNPRIKFSHGPPLSLGFFSNAEYMDVFLEKPLEGYQIEKFKKSTIEGLIIEYVEIHSNGELPINKKLKGFRFLVESEKGEEIRVLNTENIVEKGKERIIFDIYKENGSFKNPGKQLEDGKYRFTKINCIWKEKNEKEGNEL